LVQLLTTIGTQNQLHLINYLELIAIYHNLLLFSRKKITSESVRNL